MMTDPINRDPRPLEEAQKELKQLNRGNRRMWVFCPVIKDNCRTDCEAFVPGRINKVANEEYVLVGFTCNHLSMRNKNG